jgi:hypothetical protein
MMLLRSGLLLRPITVAMFEVVFDLLDLLTDLTEEIHVGQVSDVLCCCVPFRIVVSGVAGL